MARPPPKRLGGTARRRAPNVTQTVFWRTGAPKVMENVTCFEHPEKLSKIVRSEYAKYITRSDIFGT